MVGITGQEKPQRNLQELKHAAQPLNNMKEEKEEKEKRVLA